MSRAARSSLIRVFIEMPGQIGSQTDCDYAGKQDAATQHGFDIREISLKQEYEQPDVH